MPAPTPLNLNACSSAKRKPTDLSPTLVLPAQEQKSLAANLTNGESHEPRLDSSGAPSLQLDADCEPRLESGETECPSHKLLGGSIYNSNKAVAGGGDKLKRSKSQNDAHSLRAGESGGRRSPHLGTFEGHRRRYLHSRNSRDGREPLRATSSFLDFLYVQGQFADEYPPETEEKILVPPYVFPERVSIDAGGKRTDESIEDATSKVHQISAAKAIFMLLKGFIGTGVLFLPKAFSNGGLLFSLLILVFMAIINFIAMLLLVKCREKIRGSFGEIAGALFGPRVRVMVKISIVLMQLGICCCYVIFVGKTIANIVTDLSHGALGLPLWGFILLELAFYVPMSWIRQINKLSGVVMIANAFIVLGLSYVYINSFINLGKNGLAKEFQLMYPQVVYMNSSDFALFIGVSIFSYEGIGLVIPIVESMKKPEKFPAALKFSLFIVSTVFAATGALCFLTFGSNTQDIAFENFDPEDHIGLVVQILYAIAVILTVPLAMFPAIRIMETSLFTSSETTATENVEHAPLRRLLSNGSGRTSYKVKWLKNLFRTLICVMTVVVGIAGSADFEKFVNLVGAFACLPLMLIYPAVFHYKAVATTMREKLMDIFLAVVGGVSSVFVTIMTINSWINDASTGGH